MKKILLVLFPALITCETAVFAQRQCGYEMNRAALIARDPSWAQKLEAQKAGLQGVADYYKLQMRESAAKKTTTTSAIPVIFHFCVTNAQLAQIGGATGLAQRCDSQIAVLNRDYNRQNSDSISIPYGWKSRYASTGIRFGLAHTTPAGYGSPGYEIEIIPDLPGYFSGESSNYSALKHAATGGLDGWDVTKYMNIWCANFDILGLLGLTTFKSETGGTGFPVDEEGICLYYGAIGKRASPTDYYIPTGYSSDYYDLGRTLTHEVGHFFEIWHTWGDDGGLCSWNGGSDDGLADTPPEDDSHFYNWPDTIPGGTYYDGCRYDMSIDTEHTMYGVASLDFLNYTDDIAMHMFTTDQAAAMAAMALVPPTGGTGPTGTGTIGESYTLTQNPDLLNWPAKTHIPDVSGGYSLSIFPNPSTGIFYLTFDKTTDDLQQITVINMLGQEVQSISTAGQQKDNYAIDLSGMSKGIYFVRCNFASGNITRKILLQ